MRLPSLSKWKSEMPGQSRHALPDCYRRFVPGPGISRLSFDYLVGESEQGGRHCQAEHAGGLLVFAQLEFRQLYDWQVRGFSPLSMRPT
jgi:hypothetical protein